MKNIHNTSPEETKDSQGVDYEQESAPDQRGEDNLDDGDGSQETVEKWDQVHTFINEVDQVQVSLLQRINELRLILDVNPAQTEDTSLNHRLEELTALKESLNIHIEALESEMLGDAPPGYLEDERAGIEKKVQYVTKIAESTPEERHQEVTRVIEDRVHSTVEGMQDLLEQSGNKKSAENLLKLKIYKALWERGEEYIETGEPIDISYVASLTYLKDPHAKKSTERYWINGVILKFLDHEIVVLDSNQSERNSLLDKEEQHFLEKNKGDLVEGSTDKKE